MRATLVIVGLAAIVLVVLMSLGMVSIQQTAGASFPTIRFEGGHGPEFKADVGKVGMGKTTKTVQVPSIEMKNTTIEVPTLEVEKAGNAAAPAQ